ncbi:MAG: DUF3160 domain-containing protein [Prevotella sp.]|nr:DUF3160 domain-containing protein [Prevotella sp.]MBR6997964.1 DUF3160 domain-containing protein [Prevotella sp.]
MKKGLFFLSMLLVLAACKNTGNKTGADPLANEEVAECQEFNPHSFLMTQDSLPDKVDLSVDINDMTYQELRLLKDYVYATKGVWFMEGEVNAFFSSKCEWYYSRCYDYMEAHEWEANTDLSTVKLTDEEKAFVDKIDARMAEMEKSREMERGGQKLLNPAMAVNMFVLDEFDQQFYAKLNQNNFVITPTDNAQLFNIYEQNDYDRIPSYVTTDVYLQAFHMYFSYVLKMVERREFVDRLHQVCTKMNERAMKVASQTTNAEIKDMAEYNAAFFAIGDRLLTGNKALAVPEKYVSKVEGELANIEALQMKLSPMMAYRNLNFAYDLFTPRGHYTRTEEQKMYFRAMMWLQTCTFCRENEASVKYASMMAYLLNSLKSGGKLPGQEVYETLNFLMGEVDNVSVFDMAEYFAKQNYTSVDDLVDAAKLKALDAFLTDLFKERNRVKSKISEDGCEDKINFMPQRYTPDGEVLTYMFDETPNSGKPFPSGLDVFAAFGVAEADNIINDVLDYPALWSGYEKEAKNMKDKFAQYADWDKSMYNKWFECLVALQNSDKNYPSYMNTPAWARKNLNTGLASWAELKHDAILYAEQPICAECGGGSDFPEPFIVGYVEPNLKFWNKMREMLTMTRTLLEQNNLMNADLQEKTERIEEHIDFCIAISKKELEGKALDEQEYRQIEYLGSSIEWFTLSVIDPDVSLSSWGMVEGADRSIAQVADVFTRNVIGCDKCGILYEATGNADAIYVIVDIGGKTYLTRGATYSYYEFVNELGKRLTDEEWQKRLEKNDAPGRPKWMLPLIIDKKPTVNEEIFYSTGC